MLQESHVDGSRRGHEDGHRIRRNTVGYYLESAMAGFDIFGHIELGGNNHRSRGDRHSAVIVRSGIGNVRGRVVDDSYKRIAGRGLGVVSIHRALAEPIELCAEMLLFTLPAFTACAT